MFANVLKLVIALCLAFVLFLWYVEKTVGNVFIRPNSLGNRTFSWYLLASFLIEPLYNKHLWYMSLLDINSFVVIPLFTGVLLVLF